jgi:hypothetical protein
VFHVHASNDEPEMAGVAGEPAIANAAHALPSLDRGGVSALDAAADARRPGIEQPLPGSVRMMGPSAPRHAVDQSATFERLPERLIAVGLVGEIASLVALDQRFGQRESWTLAEVSRPAAEAG